MYLQKDNTSMLLELTVVLVLFNCAESSLPVSLLLENRVLHKATAEPIRFQFVEFLRHRVAPKMLSSKDQDIANNTVSDIRHKKWQVGRVSRKQYEIINMLWRRTNEFKDIAVTTPKYHASHSSHILSTLLAPPSISSTPSFIEFYYLDEYDLNNKGSSRKSDLSKEKHIQAFQDPVKYGIAIRPKFSFRVLNPNYVHLVSPTKRTVKPETEKRKFIIMQKRSNEFHRQSSEDTTVDLSETENILDSETCPLTTETSGIEQEDRTLNAHSTDSVAHTTMYDKIKFFEIYDNQTPSTYYEEKLLRSDDLEKIIHENDKQQYEKDRYIEQRQIKNYNEKANKHIFEMNKHDAVDLGQTSINKELGVTASHVSSIKLQTNRTRLPSTERSSTPELLSSLQKWTIHSPKLTSNIVQWTDFAFMAAYIYEPSQVHCDAAGISPHWLVTSGSCLSRHHKKPGGEGRSAFVTYCGNSWWNAERVAYVKYSVVHPRYHEKDKLRRHMYNIGLIEVVISMATCPNWAPVTLMSHQFMTDPEGSKGYAVGWGLDRYDTRYTIDLPKYPLMAYESRVFHNSCPGSYGYAQSKLSPEEGGTKNVYCVTLPPYYGETTDPLHGSMLIVGDQLCAIYLQEERRPSGLQSAQYTGVWALGPWVAEVAREPEEEEPFDITM